MHTIVAVIPTKNEVQDLPRAIKSLKPLVSEILVVDSGSSDDTPVLAQKLGAKVLHFPLTDFASTRNFADQHGAHDWILSLDADMELTPPLLEEIRALPDTPAVYRIGRLNFIWGKPIYHTDWSPVDDCHIRLYHRSLGHWQGLVHEQFVSPKTPITLNHYFIHHNYQSVTEFIDKLNFYSQLSAPNHHFSWFSFFWTPFRDSFKRYIYKLGFLDGYRGLFLSYLQAIYYLSVGIKQRSS